MAYNLANGFGHSISHSFSVKDHIYFGCYGGDGDIVHGGSADDVLGELREEDIVWGEVEVHHGNHQYKDANPKGGIERKGKTINGDRRQQRSMLSRQIETQRHCGNTWTGSGTITAVLVQSNSKAVSRGAPHWQDEDYVDDEGGGSEEFVGVDGGGTMMTLPPHEMLARQYEATSTTSSVLQGAGRTLKGMDLRRLRNEVWRQTGFLG